MKAAAANFQDKNKTALRPQERTELNRSCKSVTMSPALHFPLTNVIPSSLHIVQELGQDLIEILKKLTKEIGGEELVKELKRTYKRTGSGQTSLVPEIHRKSFA